MKLRIMGLPDEAEQAVRVLSDTETLDVIQVDGPYPNRGNSRMVRMYLEARLTEWCSRSWHDGDCCEGSRKQRNSSNSPASQQQLPTRKDSAR